jgi:hypothetical protein
VPKRPIPRQPHPRLSVDMMMMMMINNTYTTIHKHTYNNMTKNNAYRR